jgi:hypothetical protein
MPASESARTRSAASGVTQRCSQTKLAACVRRRSTSFAGKRSAFASERAVAVRFWIRRGEAATDSTLAETASGRPAVAQLRAKRRELERGRPGAPPRSRALRVERLQLDRAPSSAAKPSKPHGRGERPGSAAAPPARCERAQRGPRGDVVAARRDGGREREHLRGRGIDQAEIERARLDALGRREPPRLDAQPLHLERELVLVRDRRPSS